MSFYKKSSARRFLYCEDDTISPYLRNQGIQFAISLLTLLKKRIIILQRKIWRERNRQFYPCWIFPKFIISPTMDKWMNETKFPGYDMWVLTNFRHLKFLIVPVVTEAILVSPKPSFYIYKNFRDDEGQEKKNAKRIYEKRYRN